MVPSHEEQRAVAAVSQRLADDFPGIAPEMVRDVVDALHAHFAARPIRDYVPVLVERMARSWLTENAAFVEVAGVGV